MGRLKWLSVLVPAVLAAASPPAQAQTRPYIGYVYPAGGQQGTTFQIRLGGQNLDGVDKVLVSGTGVQATVIEYFGKLDNQSMTLLREQLAELRKGAKGAAAKDKGSAMMEMSMAAMAMEGAATAKGTAAKDNQPQTIAARIEKRMAEYVQNPANAAISSLVFATVTMAPDAPPGRRELRLATTRGVTNPLVFHVGQAPEFSRKPMTTATLQVLGREEQALRKRPVEEEEVQVTVPCTANGQIASGEVNRYRFAARKGQRLVISAEARLLNPFIADAVPGWFQPVLTVRGAGGKEVAFCDDYRFKPDPVILFQVPEDGEYVFAINDAIYRGREDFVYRVSVGELPFVTSIFPLGGPAGAQTVVDLKGWNLTMTRVTMDAKDKAPGIYPISVRKDKWNSNRAPFAVDTLPECLEQEPNNSQAVAQKVTLPVIINGRVDRPADCDVFKFEGRAGDEIVAEVSARRLDSPLDSVLKLTDAAGRQLALNDDQEDKTSGVNTHDADSYFVVTLPADGTYYVHLSDAAHSGGLEYAYRLRLSQPQPDFALYVVPSSLAMRAKGTASVNVQVIRKDGFAGQVSVGPKDPPAGFSVTGGTIKGDQTAAKLTLNTTLTATPQPVALRLEGKAKIQQSDVAHEAIAAEDRMQAFLWRHLVPAEELKVLVYDASYTPPPKRVPRVPPTPAVETKATPAVETKATPAVGPKATPAVETKATPGVETKATPAVETKAPPAPAGKLTFTKQQVAGRLRQLKFLFEEGLLTDDFYDRKVAECETAQ